MSRFAVFCVLLALTSNVYSSPVESEIVSGDFTINTYGRTCMPASPLPACILQQMLTFLEAKKILAPETTRKVDSDESKIEFGFAAFREPDSLEFYKMQIKTADTAGWIPHTVYIPKNGCSSSHSVRQVYHTSKTVYKRAEIYTWNLGEPVERVGEIDISACLLSQP